jgi:hypothetical protein
MRSHVAVRHRGITIEKDALLSQSLSILLPVYNAQATLPSMAADLLEVLPELTPQFEMLVIDDGSTDATFEAAHDLAGRYPQVRVTRNSTRLGRSRAIRAGLDQTSGDLVLWCDEECQLDLRDVHKLWQQREAFDAVLAWPADANSKGGEGWSLRMRAWRLRISKQSAAPSVAAGYQLMRRKALQSLHNLPTDRCELLSELTRLGFTWQVLEVRANSAARRDAGFPGQSWQPTRLDARPEKHGPVPSRLRMRNIERLKDFALGE